MKGEALIGKKVIIKAREHCHNFRIGEEVEILDAEIVYDDVYSYMAKNSRGSRYLVEDDEIQPNPLDIMDEYFKIRTPEEFQKDVEAMASLYSVGPTFEEYLQGMSGNPDKLAELIETVNKLIPMAEDAIAHYVLSGTHVDELETDRETLEKAKQLIGWE